MNASCMKCGAHIESSWKFCPECGTTQVAEAPLSPNLESSHLEPPQPQEHERSTAQYGFIGLVLGLFAATPLVIYGGMMCLLGPPMVFGIPLIIMGVAAPILGPYLAINAVRGKCPWCGEKITSIGPLDAFFCQKCSHRIAVKNHHMVRA
jgi:DNA-directed RNA polymerase subunit RPC12/RpoP